MEQLKTIAETIGLQKILTHIRDHYGAYVFTATIAIVVGIGIYFGYTPEQVMAWLGQGQ